MAKPIEIVGPCPLCEHTSLHVQVGPEKAEEGSTAERPKWVIPLECQDCHQHWTFSGYLDEKVAVGDGRARPAEPQVLLDEAIWGSDKTWLTRLQFEHVHWRTFMRLEGRYGARTG